MKKSELLTFPKLEKILRRKECKDWKECSLSIGDSYEGSGHSTKLGKFTAYILEDYHQGYDTDEGDVEGYSIYQLLVTKGKKRILFYDSYDPAFKEEVKKFYLRINDMMEKYEKTKSKKEHKKDLEDLSRELK